MIVSANTPIFLPPLIFFKQWACSNLMLLADNTQFVKHGIINRSLIFSEKGPMWLTIPVLAKGRGKQLIRDVEINNDIQWQKKIINTLRNCYSKAPYFEHFSDELFQILEKPWHFLLDINLSVIDAAGQLLRIRTPLKTGKEHHIDWSRPEIFTRQLSKLGYSVYLADPVHSAYLPVDTFNQNNLQLKFAQFPSRLPFHEKQAGIFHWLVNYGPELAVLLRER